MGREESIKPARLPDYMIHVVLAIFIPMPLRKVPIVVAFRVVARLVWTASFAMRLVRILLRAGIASTCFKIRLR